MLVLDDEARGSRLSQALHDQHGHACHHVSSLEDALESLRSRTPDVVVTSPRLDGRSAVEALAADLAKVSGDAVVLVVGADQPLPDVGSVALRRVSGEADDRELTREIDSIAAKTVAAREDRRLRESLEEQRGEIFEGIVGSSPQIRKVTERIKKAARNKATVLILGETGTGKELIAEAIHRQSDRARKPLKSVNCAGLNENLLESELFGHVRGAYTGAVSDRKGYFAAADGGTLFLDEVGDMPLVMQAKLLRALDRREITPVGSTDVLRVDVRVIAATNRDLRELVEKKEFREDLFYRLNQFEIRVPPLRERRQDIPLLAVHLLEEANREHGTAVPSVSSEAMSYLTRYFWPGNVRELRNVIVRLACEVIDRQIEADDLPEGIRGSRELVPLGAGGLVGLTWDQVERMLIERTLQATGGNREQAAKMLNIGTRTLYRKIKEYGL